LAFIAACAGPGAAPKGEPAQPAQERSAAVKAEPTQPAQAATGITVTDDAGRTVKLARPATKIISLAPSNTELVFAIGAGDKVVAVDNYSDYPAEAKSREKVGGFADTNIEKVVASGADLVLATNIHEKGIVPELERRGIAVVVVQPKSIEGVLESARLIGKLSGKEREAEELAGNLRRRLSDIGEKVKGAKARPRTYVELDSKLFTVGPGSFMDDMITRAGGQNIAADAKTQWPQLSEEALLLKDPEVIFLTNMGAGETPAKVKARPAWQAISAVKNGRIVELNPDLVNRPGPRVLQGLEEMARALQPELFR